MSMGCSDPAPTATLTREAAEMLASELAGEMIQRWRRGERPLPEEFLIRHPELWSHPEAAADLIYEELCLRQEHGPEVPVEQILLRFPQWRSQLAVLFDCQRVLSPRRVALRFPAAGESLGDFLLLDEIGSGSHGRVFLATQISLGDRPVVLKLTPCDAREHLSLARLQHTHIVPLYSVQDHTARGLRVLCMPYFGGATLARLLEELRPLPSARRSGRDVLTALERESEEWRMTNGEWRIDRLTDEETCNPSESRHGNSPFAIRLSSGPAQQFLTRASYVQAICWMGACLSDALQYAHERGLVHLDLKPSNVLLAADGQPMLLDFHLAREPIHPDEEGPTWLGGTTGYMSPEQQAALHAIQQGRKVPLPVDGRSDVYSLGVVLFETLGGKLPELGEKPRPLHHFNARVSIGLADVIGKCLASDAGDRYPDAAALAADLRRYLADLPFAGVRNRSLTERWRKWRRRRPHGVALAGMMFAVLTAAAAVAVGAASHIAQRTDEARTALNDGQVQIDKGEWEGAIGTLRRGQSAARANPFRRDLANELDHRLSLAEQGRTSADRTSAARELHQLTDNVRFLYGTNDFPPETLRRLEPGCRSLWQSRDRIVERLSLDGGNALEPAVRDDLLDLAIFWADLQVRLAPPIGKEDASRTALAVLAQAEALFGPSLVLNEERKLLGELERPDGHSAHMHEHDPAVASHTTWEHYALGRSFLRGGNLERAAEEVRRAVRLEPQGMWPNFYQGICAYRLGRYADAVTAYSVCIGAAPKAACCFFNRALAYEALGVNEKAFDDYDQVLRLDPSMAVAALNRGMLQYRVRHFADALDDLRRAGELGADPAIIAFDLALVNLARGDTAAALDDLRRAICHNPLQSDARKLRDCLSRRRQSRDLLYPTTSRSEEVEKSAPAPASESR